MQVPHKQEHHSKKRREKADEKVAKLNLLASLARLLAALIDIIHK